MTWRVFFRPHELCNLCSARVCLCVCVLYVCAVPNETLFMVRAAHVCVCGGGGGGYGCTGAVLGTHR